MQAMRFYPLFDKLFWIISVPTALLLLAATVIPAIFDLTILFLMLPLDLFTLYFIVSPFFGYVELREEALFIQFGLFMKKEIPYAKIRGVSKERKWYSESMMSLKNAMEHVNIRYGGFDVVTVSVKDNDAFIEALNKRR